MAANNYFGFAQSGTQYSAQPAGAYPTAQTAYVQTAQPAAYAAAAPRAAAAYETGYQAAHTTGQYAYTAPRSQPTATYDTKTYFTPAASAQPAAGPTAVYTVAETQYQAAKPAYTGTNYSATPARQAAAPKPGQATYVYPSTTAPSTQPTTYTNTTSSSYDPVLYSAASNYYQQQATGKPAATSGSWKYSKTAVGAIGMKPKPKPPPKQPQLHYCEVCKISCAGPQTYREHLEGQKHKKKEAASKGGSATPTPVRGQNQLRCELCDVACTGSDAYAAHIRGAKHQKVLKLHTKLGKPIPSTEPTVVGAPAATPSATAKAVVNIKTTGKTTTVIANPPKKIVSTPKITFVGGTKLQTTGAKTEEVKTQDNKVIEEEVATSNEEKLLLLAEKDVAPVGTEYIEEVKNEVGKVVSFNCKLCECKFNDPNAKEMHMKGRRHRLQYKKKVDPSLQVEVKPSIRARKVQEEKMRRQAAKEEYWRRRDAEDRWREEMMRMEEEHYFMRGFPPRGMPGPMMNPMMRRPDTSDDRHVTAKHASIYPTEIELQAVQNIVSSCEKALKMVSDFIAEVDSPKPMDIVAKKTDAGVKATSPINNEVKEEEKKENDAEDSAAPSLSPRTLKGVMRVGVLAKGLLLQGDLNVQLVLLCSEKPTRTLLERVTDALPKQIAGVTEDTYDVKMCVEEAAVVISSTNEPKTTCTVTLTSPIMRDDSTTEGESTVLISDPPDVLDRHKCLEALAALRHAKWFQARANGLQSCVVLIRILRDLCHRVDTWVPLSQWAMELLVEKCVSSGGNNMSPGDALRRVFECISSGILLPGGPGLLDPCEKEPLDAASSLSPQEREDITASAQHALRLIAFRQIHKVLGMEALPAPRFQRGARFNPRKRRRTNSTGEGVDEEGKKDKKEEGEEETKSAEEKA